MADEKILISIEIEKGENEKEVDNLTKKITSLQHATAALKKENNELIKQGQENSQQYVENTRQIEINKQKITEATSTRKNLISTLVAEDDSIKSLNVRNAELIKQRNLLSTSTEEGRAGIAKINEELDKNNKTIKENVSNLEKQKINIGNYKSALDGIVPGFSGFVDGVGKMTKAALVFMATPLGLILAALGAALFALTSYFKGSEKGQNDLNKIVAVGSAIFEQFMNIVEDVGKFLFEAFSNPKQAAIDFVDFLKDQVINRFVGLLELIPKLGQAIELLFAGEFAEAGKVAGDAVGKVVLGIENATDKIGKFLSQTAALVEQGIKNGERLAELNAQIDRDERKLIVDREKTNLEVQKIRAEALELEGEARKKVLSEAIKLQEDLAARETQFAKLRLAQAEQTLKTNGDDKEALKAVAEARAAVFAAEATAFQNTLQLKKELEAIDKQIASDRAKLDEEAEKLRAKQEEAELERQQRIREALNETEQLRLEQEILKVASIEERVAKEIELESFKTQVLLENTRLSEEEANLIIQTARANRNAIILKGDADLKKKELDAEKKLLDEKKKIQAQETAGRRAATDTAIGLATELFGKNKAIATAEVIVNTIRAITRAYADFMFPASLIVSLLMGGLGAAQIARINGVKFFRGGIAMVKKFFGGGVARTGGILQGPTHAQGGIPFTVARQPGFEAEGGEALINRRSTQMYRKELSAINRAGGGVAFAQGGIVSGTATRQASQQAESRTAVRDAVQSLMDNMPPIIVTVEDINARQDEVSTQTQKAFVI